MSPSSHKNVASTSTHAMLSHWLGAVYKIYGLSVNVVVYPEE